MIAAFLFFVNIISLSLIKLIFYVIFCYIESYSEMIYYHRMIAAERHKLIEKIVHEKGSATVEVLLEQIPVSKMTLWRDINKLHEQGRVQKVHGGAFKVDKANMEPGFYSKSLVHGDIKEKIAECAAHNFINNGDVVILEGGTTVMNMVKYIHHHNVSVLTNGLNTLNTAVGLEKDITIMVCGGILRKPSLTFVGPEAQKFFRDFSADILFLSGTGISPERGLTDPSTLEIEVKQAMIGCAQKLVVLIDSSKFYEESLKTIVDLQNIEAIVTDKLIPRRFLDICASLDIQVLIAD